MPHANVGVMRDEEHPMDFTMSTKQKEWLDRVQVFMNKHVRPAVPIYDKQDAEGPRWKVIPIIEEVLMVSRGASCTAMTRKPKISRGSRNFTLDELLADTQSGLTEEIAPDAPEIGKRFAGALFQRRVPPRQEASQLVQAFPSDRTDQPFGICVLPRGARRRRLVADAYRLESANKDLAIGPVPVTNEIAGSLFPAAGFRDLICDPICGRMRCDAKP